MAPPSTIRTTLTAIWCAFHTFQYGFHISALNGVQDALTCSPPGGEPPMGHLAGDADSTRWLKPCVAMSLTDPVFQSSQFGLVVAIFTLGGLAGSLLSNGIANSFGRIGTMRISAFCIFLGSTGVGLSNSFILMLVARVIIGFGCGLATVTVPLALAQLGPTSIRRSLGILNQLFIVFGMFTAQSLAFPWARPTAWRYVVLVSMGIALVQLGGSLLVRPHQEETGEGVGEEDRLLPSATPFAPLSIRELLVSKDPKVSSGLLIVIVTQLTQQLCGISPVMYFSTRILTPVFKNNSKYIAIGIILLKIPMTMLSAYLVRKTTSRNILLTSSSIMSLSALLLAIALNISSQPLCVISALTFISAFSIGLGPVTWIVLGEVMPSHAAVAAGAVGLAMNWTTNFCISAAFLPLQQFLRFGGEGGKGNGNVFFVFVGTCIVGFVGTRYSYQRREVVGA